MTSVIFFFMTDLSVSVALPEPERRAQHAAPYYCLLPNGFCLFPLPHRSPLFGECARALFAVFGHTDEGGQVRLQPQAFL